MLTILRNIILFIAIFSFYNDNLVVDIAGSSSLKVIFALFIAINIIDIGKATIEIASNMVMKSYNIFIIIFSTTVLISVVFFDLLELFDALLVIVGLHVVFVYFSYYKDFNKLLYFIWASVFISAFYSLFNEPIAEFTYRITGGTADPVEFSVHLFTAIFITIFLFNKNKNYLFLISSILLFLYAMLNAGSKTAILTIVLLVLYTLVVRFKHIFKAIYSFKSIIAISIILFVAFQTDVFSKLGAVEGFKGRVETKSKTMGTAETRFASWDAGYRMIGDYLFTGVGPNQFSKHATKYLQVSLDDEGLLNPHNIFVKMFSEAGIFSFLSFIVFLFFLLKARYFKLLKSEYFWISLIPLATIMMGLALNITFNKHFWLSLALWSNVILMYRSSLKEEIV